MPSDSCFLRARRPQQKEQRRQQILDSAAFLLERDGFDNVSLNGIARQTGVAKSNIYRYFESREDIFLQLLHEDYSLWFETTKKNLQPLENSDDIEAVTQELTDAINQFPRMCQLISVFASVLEKNVSEEHLREFKLRSVNLGARLITAVSAALPGIKNDNLIPALHSMIALIAGLWPLSNPTPAVEKVMEHPQLAPYKLEFCASIQHSIRLILKGAY